VKKIHRLVLASLAVRAEALTCQLLLRMTRLKICGLMERVRA